MTRVRGPVQTQQPRVANVTTTLVTSQTSGGTKPTKRQMKRWKHKHRWAHRVEKGIKEAIERERGMDVQKQGNRLIKPAPPSSDTASTGDPQVQDVFSISQQWESYARHMFREPISYADLEAPSIPG
ncbi:hypothetical protein N7495_002542 [Penicillium taxi]|uniref:uncharacterized protein n=1 Tax=Penicillium taxi TaxID=168475 RepID=UPI002545095D|nr:uncharacterized protein N7495_002542 [Penicillium taxi]KAJ5902014.1 hypothetical protein N7495_002542 [Penicillium taxi]